MKQDWTLRISKKDARTKSGYRVVGTYQFAHRDLDCMRREVRELQADLYPVELYQIEYYTTDVTVKNLMTGKDVQIRTEDRGGCCDPSMESYWSM